MTSAVPASNPDRISSVEADAAVSLVDVRVDYGETLAVDDLELRVEAGQIYGLVGPNGAGKTSTFKVLTGLLQPTYGQVRVDGVDVLGNPQAAHGLVGYMPDLAPVPSDLTVGEFLRLFGRVHGLSGTRLRARIDECLEQVELVDKRHAWCRELSRGMMQRLVLAKTLLHRPRVMVLDEPASGMDPRSRANLRGALRTLASEGVAVLLSSHILSELAEMCTHLGLLREGRLLISGAVEDVLHEAGEERRILLRSDPEAASQVLDWLRQCDQVGEINPLGARQWEFEFSGDDEAQRQLLAAMIGAGLPLTGFMQRHRTLEDIVLGIESGQEGVA